MPCPAILSQLSLPRSVTGTLKGYDALLNLVLDEVEEDIRGKHLSQLHITS